MEIDKPETILRKLLNEIFTKDFVKFEIKIEELNTKGANYSSIVYKVAINTNENTLKLFAKVATWPESIRAQLNFEPAFEIERYFYTDIVSKYEMIQEKYSINSKDRITFPKFYGANSKVMEETIVLQDLISDGYSLYDRCEPANWEYASKAVEEIAKFHALSFAYKNEFPDQYEKNKPFFDWKRSFFINLREPYQNTAKSVYEVIPEHLKQRFKDFIRHQLSDEMFEKYYGCGKWGVLLHGDYRSSNIMYKISSDGQPSLIPVDFQNLHLGSPSTDLFYLIYTATDELFRKQHLKALLSHYYETFSSWLKLMNLDPNIEFSREDFDADYADNLGYGLCVATFLLPIVLVDVNEAPPMDNELSDIAFKLSSKFKNRFLPILYEFVNYDVLC